MKGVLEYRLKPIRNVGQIEKLQRLGLFAFGRAGKASKDQRSGRESEATQAKREGKDREVYLVFKSKPEWIRRG